MGRICRKEYFKSGMKERVGDEKLIIIISVAVRGFTLVHATADAGRLHRYCLLAAIILSSRVTACSQHMKRTELT